MGFPVDTANTKSLIHFNGYHNQAGVFDWSGKVWTVYGNAKLDAGNKKYGNASLFLDGSSYIYTADHTDWTLGSGPFSIEAFVKPFSIAGVSYWDATSRSYCIASKYQDANNYWQFYIEKQKDKADPRSTGLHFDFYWLTFIAVSNGTTVAFAKGLLNNYSYPSSWVQSLWNELQLPEHLRTNDWDTLNFSEYNFNHVAVVSTGSELKLFFNGMPVYNYVLDYVYSDGYVPVGGNNITANLSGPIVDDTGMVYIGRGYPSLSGATVNFIGYIDEFRFVKGVDLFTSLYQSLGTVMPTSAYVKYGVDDEYTTMLLHFDTNYIDTATGNSYVSKSATTLLTNTSYMWVKSVTVPTGASITYARESPSLYNTVAGQPVRMNNIDFWWNVPTLPTNGKTLVVFIEQGASVFGGGSLSLGIYFALTNTDESYYYTIRVNSINYSMLIPDGLIADTWYHVGLSFDPANAVVHIGHSGKYLGSMASSQYIDARYPHRNILFGYYAGASTSITSYIDEVRVSMDCLRYTADYIVNNEEYGTTISNRELNEAMMIGDEFETNFREVSDAMTIGEAFIAGYQYDVLLDEEASVAYTTNAEYVKQISPSASANFTLDSTTLITKRDFSFSVEEFIDSYKYYILAGAAETPVFIGTGQCGFAADFYLEVAPFTGDGFCGARADSNDSPIFTGNGQATLKNYIDCNMVVDSPVFEGTGYVLVGVLCTHSAVMPTFDGNATMLHNITMTQATTMPVFIGYGDAVVPETHTEEGITEFDNYILWHEHEGFVCYHRVKMPLLTGTGSVS
jgi:hypothetical protein